MKMIPLVELAEINPRMPERVTAMESGSVTFLPMAGISEEGQVVKTEIRDITEVRKGYRYFEEGDILLAKITPCMENGKAALARSLPHPIGFGSTEFHVLRPRIGVEPRFVFHAVWNQFFREVAHDSMTGAAGQKRVPTEFLKEYLVPDYPLEEQKRIANILDKADSLRRKRAEAIRLADDFLKSTFLDMFGDPVTNPMGWELRPLADLGALDRGVSKHRPRNAPILLGGPYPLIQTGDIANSQGYVRRHSSTYSEIGLQQSKLWPAGTLCITIAANIANTGILTYDACFPDSVVGFTPSANSTVEFIQGLIGFFRKSLDDGATQVAQKNINLRVLRTLNVPCPPKFLQEKYTDIVKKTNKLLFSDRENKNEIETFFSSFQKHSFQLTL